MRTSPRIHVTVVIASCLALFVASAPAANPPAPGSLRELVPPSSIDSVERADAALVLTEGAKGRVQREYRANAKDCAAQVLVNACLDQARDLQRQRLADIEAVEIEANRFRRRDKADRLEADRAKREAERKTNAPADDARRAASRKSFDDKQTQVARDTAAAAAKASAPRVRKPVLTPPAAPTDAEAKQRAKNAVDYAAKQREAATHLKDIERRSAERVADRKRRADEKKAKDAKIAAGS